MNASSKVANRLLASAMALLLNVPAITRVLTGIIAFLPVDPKPIVLIRCATLSALHASGACTPTSWLAVWRCPNAGASLLFGRTPYFSPRRYRQYDPRLRGTMQLSV